MERHCSSCGARISDDMKICGNCGKIIPPQRQVNNIHKRPLPQKNNLKQNPVKKQNPNNRNIKKPVKQKSVVKPVEQTKNKVNIKKWLKVLVIILVIYVAISLVQIFRVRVTGYDFKSTDMKMSQKNFGQAVDNFFESGHWVYNPFTLTVKYSGETKDGYEYDLKFSAFATVSVKEIAVDGEKKADSQIESAIMGMFI